MKSNKSLEFDYYLFDLDNSLLKIPYPTEYFDNILVETINTFRIKEIPQREERDKFWSLGDHYINHLKKWGINLDNYGEFWKNFDEIDFDYRKKLIKDNKISLYSDVYSVLEQLSISSKKLAIVSNTAKYIVDYITEQFNLRKYFHDAFGLGYKKEQEIAKPSPKGILQTLNKLNYNFDSSSAIMIGDSFVDIFAAKRANISACLLKRDLQKYPNGYRKWKYQPDYVIENLYSLVID